MNTTIPNPGSDEAIEQGCICPVLDNNHGQGADGGYWWITRDCPLHGAKERTMKHRHFSHRSTRVVNYYGVKISIPSDHEWVATDDDGSVFSYPIEPEEQHGVWVVPQRYEIDAVRIGTFEPGVANDVINTLCHYPIEDE